MDSNYNPGQGIGIANRSVNLNNFLGYDTNGIGFFQDGTLWNGGTQVGSGYPTWGAYDVVDLAVDNAGYSMWIRVNGGDWNNNPSAAVHPPFNELINKLSLAVNPYVTVCMRKLLSLVMSM